jgi:hypothetical protein
VFVVSPDGLAANTGTQSSPMDLRTGLDSISTGETLMLMDGIYPIASPFTLGRDFNAATHIQAAPGARPVLTTSGNKCPAVTVGKYLDVTGLWFGGTRDEDQLTELQVHTDVTLQDCVLFNFVEGIGEGTGTRCTYQRNKFINCGKGILSHSIYINNAVDHTAEILENIFVGGQAYHIHLWHDPTNTEIRNNFSGDAEYCLAAQGNDHIMDGNILWKPNNAGYPILLSTGTGKAYSNNYHGPIASSGPDSEVNGHLSWFGNTIPVDVTVSGNHYYNNTLEPGHDTGSPTTTNDGDEVTHLGKSAAQIDAAISALETAFGQTVQQIHDDATIETHFATLKAVIDTWKAQ